ncbi:response regulator [Salinisphaera sp. T31B1]|uniref:response regulator n=1 Tax=Salinisphaera sp. T31B1 TaxID=727963 RepID=UPI003342B78A
MTDSLISDYAILYVDDEQMALKYFRRFVDREFTVHTATSVDEALAILDREGASIGVLITDQRMPGQSGVDLLKKVRARWPHIVRMLTTAYADLEDAIEAVNRGEIFRYLTKPWETQTLRTELRQAMEMFTLRQERAALMREKMSVWQRLVQLGRLRDLVIMAHSLGGLTRSDRAVMAFLEAHLAGGDAPLASAEQLDLWEVTEFEIERSIAIVEHVRDAIDEETISPTNPPRPSTGQALVDLARAAGLIVNAEDADRARTWVTDDASVARLCRALANANTGPDALVVTISHDHAGWLLSWRNTPDDDRTRQAALLSVYLLAYHLGGEVSVTGADTERGYSVRLPTERAACVESAPPDGWLSSLLVRLEGWD